jgi:acyl-CoA synthetase (AMP-forming)/AMP-acid ligase II
MERADGRIPGAETIIDVLLARATDSEYGGFTFLSDGEVVSESFSWAELNEKVCSLSSGLRRRATVGSRVLLFFRPGLQFLVAFLGCLRAGVVAVPCVPPTRPFRRSFERIDHVARASEPCLILAGAKAFPVSDDLGALAPALSQCPIVDPATLSGPSEAPRARADGIAFLQFTSGSTSAPKGVVVTHANLMNNLGYIHECVDHSRASVSVMWLPVYHDMGLIDGMLEPIFGGFRCLAMPPHAFVQRPARWLRAISRYRATHGGGPNFAYDLCVAKIPAAEAAELDLSSWRYAHNGAEPIRLSTLEAFAERFAASGFRLGNFHPCYGLAEATLKVTGGAADTLRHRYFDARALERDELIEVHDGAEGARAIASSGPPFRDFTLAIVDPETNADLGERRIGEIWLSGPSVTAGYYGDERATEAAFGARMEPGARGPFLRTGDLGFIVGRELYVAGRLKDLIILSGRNIYPQDVERSVETAHDLLWGGCAAAFSIDDGQREHLAVLFECVRRPSDGATNADFSDVIDAVERAVARDHLVGASVLAVLPRGALLKTSSGKIRRRACRRAFQEGSFEVLQRRERSEQG